MEVQKKITSGVLPGPVAVASWLVLQCLDIFPKPHVLINLWLAQKIGNLVELLCYDKFQQLYEGPIMLFTGLASSSLCLCVFCGSVVMTTL